MFVGSSYGLFISTDKGVNWTIITNTAHNINSMVLSEDFCYIGSALGVSYSPYDNISWTVIDSGMFTGSLGVTQFNLSGSNLLAVSTGDLYLSVDKILWTKVVDDVSCIAVKDNMAFAGTTDKGILLSNDNGVSWDTVETDFKNIQHIAVSGNSVYVVTKDKGIFVSTDNGNFWNQISSGIADIEITKLYVNEPYMYAVTTKGLFISSDHGKKWTLSASGLENALINCVTVHGNDLYAGSVSGGVFVSNDNGKSWEPMFSATYNQVFSIVSTDNAIFAYAVNGAYVSQDGNSWNLIERTSDIVIVVFMTLVFAPTPPYQNTAVCGRNSLL